MTILQKPPRSGAGHAGKGWFRFGHADEAVRHTDAWEHETFAEEQARRERTDPAYARICEQVRLAKKDGEQASRRADHAKADWDARVATQRQAHDNAQKEHHALKTDLTAQTPDGEVTDTGDAAPPKPPKTGYGPHTADRRETNPNPNPTGGALRC